MNCYRVREQGPGAYTYTHGVEAFLKMTKQKLCHSTAELQRDVPYVCQRV